MKQMNSSDYVNWIRTQTGLPWLMLDFKCPWEDILPEVERMTEWIPYRNESGNNWSSYWQVPAAENFYSIDLVLNNYTDAEEFLWPI